MDSLRKRYFYKLGGGSFSMAASGVIQALVLRALGPAGYGNFNFLNTFFIQAHTFLDMGTSDGFYTKISKRPKETDLVTFYLFFMVFVCLAILGLTILGCASPWASLIWPSQQTRYIVMGAVMGIISWIVLVFNKTTDAYGLTAPAEISRALQKGIGIIILIPLVWFHRLSLTSLFFYWYGLMILLILSYLWINAHYGHPLPKKFRLPLPLLKSYASEFYHYSHPLAVYAAVAFITGVLGRWLLQIFSGSAQQAFFGLSYQICTLCVLGVTAMSPLLMREFSIAHHNLDLPAMAALFRKHIPLLYSVTAYFSCFVALEADTVVRFLGGHGYAEASTAVMLMSISAIHQTYGQLSGSVFFAIGRTDIYRNICITTMLAGSVMNYFLLAPASAGGLHLGATGLAIQTLATQFVSVNIQLYFNAKFLRLPFLRYLGHQIVSLATLLALAYASRWLADALIGPGTLGIGRFVSAGICYTTAVGVIAWTWPRLFGLRPGQLASIFKGPR